MIQRAQKFCDTYGLKLPVMLAPMAGACPVRLSVGVANAGGMGAMGALSHTPDGIRDWVREFREASSGPLQLNTWVPDPPAHRDRAAEARVRDFMAAWGPEVPASAGDASRPDFHEQLSTFLEVAPTAVSVTEARFVRSSPSAKPSGCSLCCRGSRTTSMSRLSRPAASPTAAASPPR